MAANALSSNQPLEFINLTVKQKQLKEVGSQDSRTIVRSHAMVATRRRQLMDSKRHLRLKWTCPKVRPNWLEVDSPGINQTTTAVCEYKFVNDPLSTVTEVADGDFNQGVSVKKFGSSKELAKQITQLEDDLVFAPPTCSKSAVKRCRAPGFGSPELTACNGKSWVRLEEPSLAMKENALIWHNPAGVLGAGRVNPFESYPVPVNRDMEELVDHYTVMIPLLIYGTRCRNPVQKSYYYLALNDKAAFSTILSFAANHLDSLHGVGSSERALRYTIEAIRATNDRIRTNAAQYDNQIVFAIALLAITERRFGCPDASKRHWMALKEIIAQRGGLKSLKYDRSLEAMLTWNDMVWSQGNGLSEPNSFHWQSLCDSIGHATHNTEECLTEFVQFIDKCELKALQCGLTGIGLPEGRRNLFSDDSVLYRTLHPLGRARSRIASLAHLLPHQRHQTNSICQISCLIYLNLVFSENADHPNKAECFLQKLEICIYEEDYGITLSSEHLLIRLLIGLEGEQEVESRRASEVMRLVQIWKRLGNHEWDALHHRLWSTLTAVP